MNQQIRFCTTSDNVKIAYAISGDGPPLAMCAPWLTHLEHQWKSLAWRPWLEAFSKGHTLLRYDSRGCGLSDREVDDVSFESWTRDFEAVVDAAGFERCALLGTCQGGPTAIEYAARHPQRVTRMVLYGTYARGRSKRVNTPQQVEKGKVLLEMTKLGWGDENHAFLQAWASQFQPGGTLEHLRSWSEQQRASTTPDMAVRLMESGWNIEVTQAARRIQCPVLCIAADRDVVTPIDEARLLAGLIPDCRFVQVDTVNHMPLADEPAWQRIVEEAQSFLAEPAAAPAAASARRKLPLAELTPQERNVLEGIARGQDNAEIAQSLGLSEKTVRNHITRVFDKIGVEQRYQAIILAREAGLGMH
jgi:pimeloyl-ACP methyl ester carboxylesterase/DNA-binding CsgD family transcriptional regulator